ncbi:hypothetical protein [Ancylobacter sp.]|uniref:hypothetical protein n=1 Tax=Ancylobacter sp. TaxID=1872567 RepID=UPI003BAA6850
MVDHGQGRQGGRSAARTFLLAGAALALAGCASLERSTSGSGAAATSGSGESAAASADSSRAATTPAGRQKLPEPAYPTFGAPAQIGDRPVMTPQQQQAVQKNLENLASQREKEMLRQIEDGQDGQAGQ